MHETGVHASEKATERERTATHARCRKRAVFFSSFLLFFFFRSFFICLLSVK